MTIKAVFPTGTDAVTTNNLYQWDYGQVLEIESSDLPTLIEVHFAYQGLSEAIVRSCSVSNKIGTVTIPNQCLEQYSPITAWVYEISGTLGRTTKKITIPITARTRPGTHKAPPEEYTDKYTELISEVNEAVGALTSGKVAAEHAHSATNASYASASGNASTASFASSAESANTATKLINGGLTFGRVLINSYNAKENLFSDSFGEVVASTTLVNKLLVVEIEAYAGDSLLSRFRTYPFNATRASETYPTGYINFGDSSFRFYTVGDSLYFKQTGSSSSCKYYLKAIYEEL